MNIAYNYLKKMVKKADIESNFIEEKVKDPSMVLEWLAFAIILFISYKGTW